MVFWPLGTVIEDILLDPVAGAFDVGELERRLAATRFAIRDEVVANRFTVYDDAAMARDAIVDPSRWRYHGAIVMVRPERVSLAYRLGGIEPLRAFAHWLAGRYSLRYLDETFGDLTPSVDDGLVFLFGPRP